jgi:hypothetical protein
MLTFDKHIFADHLNLTQAYCDLQVKDNNKDNARAFRSYNPLYNNVSLFKFKTKHFDFEIEPNIKHCTLTTWAVDPTDRESIIDNLFIDQINNKIKYRNSIDKNKIHLGKILVSQIDCTLTDGASEVQSLGLIDRYDIPPIDTWFYLTRTKESRLLFAWIPNGFMHRANEAIEVNCVDCINWFEVWYPKEFENISTKAKNSL